MVFHSKHVSLNHLVQTVEHILVVVVCIVVVVEVVVVVVVVVVDEYASTHLPNLKSPNHLQFELP
jgi:hypothetical protein